MNTRNFNKAIALVAALLAMAFVPIASCRAAQGQTGPGGWIAKALNLTDDQKAQLKPLLFSAHQQFRSIRGDTSLTPDQRRQKIQALRAQIRGQVDQILTPAQQQELIALRAKWRQQRFEQTQGQSQPTPSP